MSQTDIETMSFTASVTELDNLVTRTERTSDDEQERRNALAAEVPRAAD